MDPSIPETLADIEYKKLLRWYIRELSCKICRYNIMPPIVKVCRLGHNVCRDCSLNIAHRCPVCDEPALLERHSSMEEIAVDLPITFACKYARWGCHASLPYMDFIKHQPTCEFQNLYVSPSASNTKLQSVNRPTSSASNYYTSQFQASNSFSNIPQPYIVTTSNTHPGQSFPMPTLNTFYQPNCPSQVFNCSRSILDNIDSRPYKMFKVSNLKKNRPIHKSNKNFKRNVKR